MCNLSGIMVKSSEFHFNTVPFIVYAVGCCARFSFSGQDLVQSNSQSIRCWNNVITGHVLSWARSNLYRATGLLAL